MILSQIDNVKLEQKSMSDSAADNLQVSPAIGNTNVIGCFQGLPTKDEIELKQWHQWYTHFNERLQERYGISVSFDEYKLLCRSKVAITKYQSKNKAVGFLNIKGVKVRVAKERHRKRILSTALPIRRRCSNIR